MVATWAKHMMTLIRLRPERSRGGVSTRTGQRPTPGYRDPLLDTNTDGYNRQGRRAEGARNGQHVQSRGEEREKNRVAMDCSRPRVTLGQEQSRRE
eukprot:421080-Rhodomonas_salina.1